ncbi:N-acetyltransferase [[Clostridium] dakarense]|uniref:N-acetyltransferase n=1 Tax=Faecalimicrobium dakarense TaxID=1301100 RepID=UPI0004AD5367|nr:GNAT family N-acetyltransferase [[Clostridium] dakarense]
MKIIDINIENIDREHICCALSDKKGEFQVSSKKAWLKDRFDDNIVFKKGDVRGKVFIEYIPAENAWCPINADGYMFINCFWVSGKYKGQGIGSKLLNECIKDSKEKGKKGLVVLTSYKKRPYLSDGKFLKSKGFLLADTTKPYFELLYLPFEENNSVPKFKDTVKKENIKESGFTLYYSNQCPFTSKYVPIISDYAKEKGIDFRVIKYESKEESQNSITPFTTYSLYYNGEFVTHEILNDKNFEKILLSKI